MLNSPTIRPKWKNLKQDIRPNAWVPTSSPHPQKIYKCNIYEQIIQKKNKHPKLNFIQIKTSRKHFKIKYRKPHIITTTFVGGGKRRLTNSDSKPPIQPLRPKLFLWPRRWKPEAFDLIWLLAIGAAFSWLDRIMRERIRKMKFVAF